MYLMNFIITLLLLFLDGHYIYTDSNAAYLQSADLSLTPDTTYCLSFWYFVYGTSASAQLLVFINRAQLSSRPEWSRIIGQSDDWTQAQISISSTDRIQVGSFNVSSFIYFYPICIVSKKHWWQLYTCLFIY